MSRESGFSFLYVSEVLGRRVVDPSGSSLGKVDDLLAATGEMYPIVRGLVIRGKEIGRKLVPIPAQELRGLRRGSTLTVDSNGLEEVALGPHDFLVRELLLDQQIVDVQGAKVERVNDVHLLATDRVWIVHVDVGFTGLLRRLGAEGTVRRAWRLSGRELKDELIAWKFVQPLVELEEPGRPIRLKVEHAQIRDLHPGEIADILEDLGKDEQAMILGSLGPEAAADALEEAEEETQAAVIAQLEPSVAADILEEMDPSEAADILTSLPEAHTEEIIAELEATEREQIEQLIAYEERTAAGLMTPEFVSVPRQANVARAMAEVRRMAPEIESIYYAYVLEEGGKLVGVTTLRTLLRNEPETEIGEIMETRLVTVRPETKPKDIADIFQKYNFLACPVVDEEMRMMGVILLKHAFDELLPEFRREARA